MLRDLISFRVNSESVDISCRVGCETLETLVSQTRKKSEGALALRSLLRSSEPRFCCHHFLFEPLVIHVVIQHLVNRPHIETPLHYL